MSDDFKQTVDLKKSFKRAGAVNREADKNKPSARAPRPAASFEPKKRTLVSRSIEYGKSKQAKKLDRVYNDAENKEFDYKKISRPEAKRINEKTYKRIIITLAAILATALVYGLFLRNHNSDKLNTAVNNQPVWYAVKLINNEIYYGQITDITADPIVIKNVYYDYDQLEKDANKKAETNNLRLVKRGKETHGPEGTMDIVRSQVVYMEPLSQDSKVLKAILDYEK